MQRLHPSLGVRPKSKLLHLGQQLAPKPREVFSNHFLAEHLRCGLSFQLLHTLLQAAWVRGGCHGLMKPTRLSVLISCTWKPCPCKSQTESVTGLFWHWSTNNPPAGNTDTALTANPRIYSPKKVSRALSVTGKSHTSCQITIAKQQIM